MKKRKEAFEDFSVEFYTAQLKTMDFAPFLHALLSARLEALFFHLPDSR